MSFKRNDTVLFAIVSLPCAVIPASKFWNFFYFCTTRSSPIEQVYDHLTNALAALPGG